MAPTERIARGDVYLDRVSAGRAEDVQWAARSQGLSAGRAEELWAQLSRRLDRPD